MVKLIQGTQMNINAIRKLILSFWFLIVIVFPLHFFSVEHYEIDYYSTVQYVMSVVKSWLFEFCILGQLNRPISGLLTLFV